MGGKNPLMWCSGFLHSKNVFQHDLLLEMFDHKLELVGRCVSLTQHVRVDVLCCNLGNDLCRFVFLTPVCSLWAGFVSFLRGVVFRSDSWRKILFCLIDVFMCPIKFPTALLIHLLCIDATEIYQHKENRLLFQVSDHTLSQVLALPSWITLYMSPCKLLGSRRP